MAVVKISELAVAGAITGAELMEVVQGGVNKKITINDIAGFIGGGWGTTGTIATLTGDADLDLGGNRLRLGNSTTLPQLILNPANFDATISTSDGVASAKYYVSAEVGGDVLFEINANDGTANPVSILGDGAAFTIAYTADTHTFNGDVILTDLEGGGTQTLGVDNDGKIVVIP